MKSNFLEISKAQVKGNYHIYLHRQLFICQSNNNYTRTRTAFALNEVSKKYNIRLENVEEWKQKVEENGNTQAKSCRCFLHACSAS